MLMLESKVLHAKLCCIVGIIDRTPQLKVNRKTEHLCSYTAEQGQGRAKVM